MSYAIDGVDGKRFRYRTHRTLQLPVDIQALAIQDLHFYGIKATSVEVKRIDGASGTQTDK